ncbi:unnamed protein product, partial [Linum tenue]
IQLPELSVHFYHREVLFALGNLIGRTVKLDYHTENLERGKFARIPVELDMTKPLATRIRLDGFWQPVLYENLPEICFDCGRIVHTEDSCPKKVCASITVPTATPSANTPTPMVMPAPEPSVGNGPWMQVTRKSKKQNRKVAQKPASVQGSDPNQSVIQGKMTGKVPQSGKGDQNRASYGKNGKGNIAQKIEERKGNPSTSKGKGNGPPSGKSGTTSQEWRIAGGKGPSRTAQAHPETATSNQQAGTSPMTPTMSPNPLPNSDASPQAKPIIPIPLPFPTTTKENSDPNLLSVSIHDHYPKKKSPQAP